MSRSRLAQVVVAVAVVAPATAGLARAEDEDRAVSDYRALEKWLEGEQPKTPEERKALRAEMVKRFRGFLAEHPKSAPARAVRVTLGDLLVEDKKHDEALALFEQLLASGDEKYAVAARHKIVRTLIAKKDIKAARARLDAFAKDHPDEKNLDELDAYLKQLESGKAVKVGAPPPEIKAKTLSGDEVSLEAWKGKVVLVDFWATWCPPCKKELPALKKLYAELHAKGFEIVGIDGVEKDPKTLPEFLKKEQIPWPQVVEDGRPIARRYGVEALPRTVLVGKDGKVAALDLRGEALARAIRNLLDGKPLE